MQEQDVIKLGMAGTLKNYVLESSGGAASTGDSFSRPSYALDPADVINNVTKHDNETIWDQLQYQLPFGTSLEDRVRSQNIALGIPLMTVGEKRRFWVPANLAYGENPPNGAPRGQLVFDIELLSIKNL